eukprot:3408871-Pyramimonas_sp.AAC.1
MVTVVRQQSAHARATCVLCCALANGIGEQSRSRSSRIRAKVSLYIAGKRCKRPPVGRQFRLVHSANRQRMTQRLASRPSVHTACKHSGQLRLARTQVFKLSNWGVAAASPCGGRIERAKSDAVWRMPTSRHGEVYERDKVSWWGIGSSPEAVSSTCQCAAQAEEDA